MALSLTLDDARTLTAGLDHFLEAMSRARRKRRINKLIREYEPKIASIFRKQGRAFMRRFATLKPLTEAAILRETITESNWGSLWDEVAAETDPEFIGTLLAGVTAAMIDGGAEAVAEFGLGISFDLANPRAVAYLQEHGAALVTRIDATTRGIIHDIVVQGADDGWSYNRIARAIIGQFSEFAVGKPQLHIDSRAHLVAVTELGNGYEESNLIVARDLQVSGNDMEHAWQTVGDSRVSEGCRENEAAGWISLTEQFPSGHDRPLRFPGCRCSGLYRVKH